MTGVDLWAQYTVYIGGNDIKLYAPSSPDSRKPDLYEVRWSQSGSGSVTFISSSSNPTTVRGVSEGSVRVMCQAKYYNRAKWTDPLYTGYITHTEFYEVTVVDPNSGGGGGSGGGDDPDPGSDPDYLGFAENTIEGIPMHFWITTIDGEECVAVIPGPDDSQSIPYSCTKATIPDSVRGYPVRNITYHAFGYHGNLEEIVLPSTLKYVHYLAFDHCSKLTSVTSLNENPPTIQYGYWPGRYSITLYLPSEEAIERYKASWSGFKDYQLIPGMLERLELVASPDGGEVPVGTKVYLSTTNASDADIYFTLDGSTPSKSSTKYTSSGVTLYEACTLKAIAYKAGYETSDLLVRNYTIKGPKIGITQVAAGTYSSCLLKTNSSLWTNDYWPNGSNYNKDKIFIQKNDIDGVKSIAAGGYHFLFIKTDNSLWGFGGNSSGQLGDGTNEEHKDPIKIMDNVSMVSAGAYHTLIVKSDGTLWSCGRNQNFQLGDGTNINRSEPVKIADDVIFASAGAYNSFFIKVDGTLWAFGANWSGNLGNGASGDVGRPTKISNDVKYVSASWGHTLILKNNGSLWACGYNGDGQLGDGTTITRKSPVWIMDEVETLAAGQQHTLIVKKDGSLLACGSNYNGQLGDGTTANKNVPVQIMKNVQSVSAPSNGKYSMIIKKDGSLWMCGLNINGQLGDGTTEDQHTPIYIGFEQVKLSLTPTTGEIVEGTKVYMSTPNTSGTDIYYSLDGSTPSKSSTKYTSAGIAVNSACTLKAIAYKDGYDASDVLTATYTIKDDGAKGDGTLQNPFNAIAAAKKASELQVGETTSQRYYVKGIVSSIKYTYSAQYGTATFNISDDGTTNRQFYVYGSYYLENKPWVEGYPQIKIGDQVIVYGKMTNYNGTLEMADRDNYVYSHNGSTLASYAASLSSAGYATFYSSKSAYVLPNGLSAQVVIGVSNGKLAYKTIADGSVSGIIPRGVPVMLAGDTKKTGTFTLSPSESNATYSGTNLLRGSDETVSTTGDGYHYKLSYGRYGSDMSNVFGWYWGTQNGAPFQIEGHKAWLVVPKTAASRSGYAIGDDAATGIDAVVFDSQDVFFDLQGRRIAAPSSKGVYIKNGKKVVLK